MTTVIDTPEGMEYVRLLTIASSLAFEINVPGMKMSRISALKAAKQSGYTKASRKPAALRDVVALMKVANPGWEPSGTIERALNSA
jgi:hypothetical protein